MIESKAVIYRLRNASGPDPWDWKAISPKQLINFDINLHLEEIARLNCLSPNGVYKVEGFLIDRKLARLIVQEQRSKAIDIEELHNKLRQKETEISQLKEQSPIHRSVDRRNKILKRK